MVELRVAQCYTVCDAIAIMVGPRQMRSFSAPVIPKALEDGDVGLGMERSKVEEEVSNSAAGHT